MDICTIAKYIINELTYHRMVAEECNSIHRNMSYKDFMIWNIRCISELNEEDWLWLVKLCEKIENKKICLQDEESCVAFTAHAIYFDKNERLCLTNPR